MTQPIEFSNHAESSHGAFAVSQAFQDIKEAAHEHLLTRIEELGAEFGRWSRTAIQRFVDLEVEGFTRMRRIPVNETEVRQIAEALTKELAGFGPLEDLLGDPAVEDLAGAPAGRPPGTATGSRSGRRSTRGTTSPSS